MAAASREELKEYVNSKGSIPRRISRSPRILMKFAQIFKEACPSCRAKMATDPRNMQLEDFCPACQEALRPKFDWIKAKVEKMMK